MPAPRTCWRTPTTPSWKAGSWRSWTPRTGSPWWASTASGTTTSGRTGTNPKGLWRRTSWDSYRAGTPEWDVLLDVDALAAAEGEEWVFHGANFLRPAPGEPHRRALLALSPDGGDANRYREFDVEARGFVDPAAGGFDLPTAKGNASWLDADTLLVATTADGPAADHVVLRPDRR